MKSEHGKTATSGLALAALGVVYGDIGTSPLYAIHEIFAGAHHPVPLTPDNILGILSLVFWSLMLVVTLKYVSFILRADNHGEGGIMALLALAQQALRQGGMRRTVAIMLGLFGAALFYGDGAITPAISVLSAVEGLTIVAPAAGNFIIPITLAILVGLFLMQRHGTASVGKLFGPVMLIWFATLGGLGIANILNEPGVLQAVNPWFGAAFLLAHPALGFFALGSVVLAVTGAEALYADMGHFGRNPIRLAWLLLVLPALALNYFGQGALLLDNPAAIENPFYLLAPSWAQLPLIILATLATVIASQAVISGAFSISQQAIQLGFSPRLQVQHTSDRQFGQIYVPAINWVLLASVVALVLGFRSSSNLAAAYGIAVTGTMLITNLLAYFVARHLWGWRPLYALLGVTPFMLIDITFFAANSVKIADGGWFPLAFGVIVFTLLTTWKRGRQLFSKRLDHDALELLPFVNACGDCLRVQGTAVFMTHNLDAVPHTLLHILKHFKSLHETVVLASVQMKEVPRVSDADRVIVEQLPNHFWRLTINYGFMDTPDLPSALELCAAHGLTFDMMDTSFFLGRATLLARKGSEMAFWREKIFITMFRNANSASNFFNLPPNRVVELGAQVAL